MVRGARLFHALILILKTSVMVECEAVFLASDSGYRQVTVALGEAASPRASPRVSVMLLELTSPGSAEPPLPERRHVSTQSVTVKHTKLSRVIHRGFFFNK